MSVYYGPLLLAFRTGNGFTQNTVFDVEAFSGIVPEEGKGLVSFRVKTARGKEAVLTDYYTAGRKGDGYASWISCTGGK